MAVLRPLFRMLPGMSATPTLFMVIIKRLWIVQLLIFPESFSTV